jgi:hypothetical protein
MFSVLFIAALATILFFGGRSYSRHRQKHTGPVLVSHRASTNCFYFVRPNDELFVTCFDNPPAFDVKMKFRDIVYTDDNEDLKHFVKASLWSEQP